MRAAALAYYALFAISPTILIAVLAAGRIWGAEAAQEHLREQLARIVDPAGADLVLSMLQAGQDKHRSTLATLISSLVLIAGASGVMMQLQSALNCVWSSDAESKRSSAHRPGIDVEQQHSSSSPVRQRKRFRDYVFVIPVQIGRSVLLKRALCFLMVLAVAALLLISLVATAILAVMVKNLDPYLPSQSGAWLHHLGNASITFTLIVALLAMLFRWMPDTEVQWRDVWGGAVVTASLFLIGKELLGWYLGSVNLRGYGGAGALVLLLMWIYYTSLILLFGAELTQAWAQGRGRVKSPRSTSLAITAGR